MLVLVKEAAENLPGTKFALIMPILRPSMIWYNTRFPAVYKTFAEKTDQLALSNVRAIECFAMEFQQFDDHGTHLTPGSGSIFIKSMLTASEAFFGSGILSDDMDTGEIIEITSQVTPIQGTPDPQDYNTRILELERMLKQLEQKSYMDNYMFADFKDELDALSNIKKEDRIILTGLTDSIPMPVGAEEKKTWLDNMVMSALNHIDPGGAGKIIFTRQGKNAGHNIPMAEVKLDTKEAAK